MSMNPSPPCPHAPPARPAWRHGFTLIELLIAVAIFGIVLAAINGVLYGALRLRSKTTQLIEDSLPVPQAVAQIKRDLQGLVAPGGVLAGPLRGGTPGSSGVVPEGATTFYTSTGDLGETAPWGDIQKVFYYLRNAERNNPSGGRDLVRAVARNLLTTAQEEFTEQWLMSGVERLRFSFYDGTAWRETWDSTTPDPTSGSTNNLPRALRVRLDLARADRRAPPGTAVQILIPVTLASSTNLAQGTEAQP